MKKCTNRIKKIVISIYYYLIQVLTFPLPNHSIFSKVRGFLISPCFRECGKNLQIGRNVIINCIWNISIGDNVYIAHNCYINGVGFLDIGSRTIISPMCVISTSNHLFDENGVTHIAVTKKTIIGEGTYIAGNCVINAGVRIGNRVKIGGNSMVISDISDDQFFSGVPAKEV